jgi:hypothetical protein
MSKTGEHGWSPVPSQQAAGSARAGGRGPLVSPPPGPVNVTLSREISNARVTLPGGKAIHIDRHRL